MENTNQNTPQSSKKSFDINVSGLKFIQGLLMVLTIIVGLFGTLGVFAVLFSVGFGYALITLIVFAVGIMYLLVPYFVIQTVIDCMYNVQEQSKILVAINDKLKK